KCRFFILQMKKGLGGVVKSSAIFINDLNAFACCPWANVKTMMRLGGSALSMAVVVFGPSCARADTITYLATGVIDKAGVCCTPAIHAQFQDGQPYSYIFTLDTAAPGTVDGTPLNIHYENGLVSSSGQVGSYVFSTGSGVPQVGKQPGYDKFEVQSLNVTGASVSGAPLNAVTFVLRDDTRTALSGGAVPTSL